jgi:WG containing repeat
LAIAPQFDYAANFSDGLAAVKTAAGTGFIDTTGTWILQPQFASVGDFSEGWARVQVGDTWRFINKSGKFLHGELEADAKIPAPTEYRRIDQLPDLGLRE